MTTASMNEPPSASPGSTVWLSWITTIATSSGTTGIVRRTAREAAISTPTMAADSLCWATSPLNSSSRT